MSIFDNINEDINKFFKETTNFINKQKEINMDINAIYDLREFKDLTIIHVGDSNNCMQLMYDLGNNNDTYFFEINLSQDRIDFLKNLQKI